MYSYDIIGTYATSLDKKQRNLFSELSDTTIHALFKKHTTYKLSYTMIELSQFQKQTFHISK